MIKTILEYLMSLYATVLYVGLIYVCIKRIQGQQMLDIMLDINSYVEKYLTSIDGVLIFIVAAIFAASFIAQWTINLFDIGELSIEGFFRFTAFITLSVLIPFGVCTALMVAGAQNLFVLAIIAFFVHIGAISGLNQFIYHRHSSPLPDPVGPKIKREKNLPNDTGLPPRPKL